MKVIEFFIKRQPIFCSYDIFSSWAWINHVAYPDLSPRERHRFIQAFLRHIQAQDFIGAVEWTKGYYPQGSFYRAHFFPYFRSVNLYSWTFNPEINLSNVRECNEILV